MKFKLKACSIYEQGPRPKQEDSIYPPHKNFRNSDRLFILCDGMGGHIGGEIASNSVCESLAKSIQQSCPDPEGAFTDEDFKNALISAFNELDKLDNGETKKMGTTLTFLKFHEDGVTIAHIGDSRVYHIRPGISSETTKILFQTTDHSLVNDLLKVGEITPEEAKNFSQKNIITRAIQPNTERRTRADLCKTSDVKAGDYFMLCSDGILEQMEENNLKYIFSERGGEIENKTDMITKLTMNNRDNHSAWIVKVESVFDTDEANNVKQINEHDDTNTELNGFWGFIKNIFK